ncbi:MAG: flagellar biosynthetic protein FliR [Bacteroidota bacterium]
MILTVLQVQIYTLILARIAGLFISAPLLSNRTFPGPAKTAMAMWIAMVFWFVVPVGKALPDGAVPVVLLLVNELMIGFLIGFIAQTFFFAIQASGDFLDLQMGLSVAAAFDPSTGGMVSIMGRLSFYIGLVIFVILNVYVQHI